MDGAVAVREPLLSKERSLMAMARDLDELERHIDRFGSVTAKTPDVWGQARLTSYRQETEKRLQALKGDEALKEAEARKKAEELKRPTDKKEFLALAQGKAKGGDVAVARQLYSEFLKKWPKDSLAAEAHFGLGETYFAEDKCREALYEYGKLLQEHPKADSTPEAYLRSSDCFKKLKMQEESRLALEELVKGYPKSEAAKTAKARLAELDKAKKGGKK